MTNEYYTEAVVLDKEPVGEADLQISLFTKQLGRVTAKAVSARKITSKLASHLEPLNRVMVRLIQKNRFQVGDALKTGVLDGGPGLLPVLHLIKELSPEGQADPELWELLGGREISGANALSALGFDGRYAICENCGSKSPAHFLIQRLEYFCSPCFVHAGRPQGFALE